MCATFSEWGWVGSILGEKGVSLNYLSARLKQFEHFLRMDFDHI